jgi:hypothetical protein
LFLKHPFLALFVLHFSQFLFSPASFTYHQLIEFAIVKLDPPATYPKICKFIENHFPEEVKNRPSWRLRVKSTLTAEKERFPRRLLTSEQKLQEKENFPEIYTTMRGTLRAPSYQYLVNPQLSYGYSFSF